MSSSPSVSAPSVPPRFADSSTCPRRTTFATLHQGSQDPAPRHPPPSPAPPSPQLYQRRRIERQKEQKAEYDALIAKRLAEKKAKVAAIKASHHKTA
ncbi:hypothetical protein NMY22_g13168 [Coprinellus aureogranulatus]|nr:hypothetical protein NMY22_g13168 [Coprinellus aureogranulatus]